MKTLEERLGIPLLTRTTRNVSPTEAGGRLLRTLGPRFDEVDAAIAALNELRDKPAGSFRITAGDLAARHPLINQSAMTHCTMHGQLLVAPLPLHRHASAKPQDERPSIWPAKHRGHPKSPLCGKR